MQGKHATDVINSCCISLAMYRLPLNSTRTPLKLTCTLTTVRPENIDVFDVAIWLKQGPQLLLGDIPGDLHRSEGVSWSSKPSSKTPTAADVPLAGTGISNVLYYKHLNCWLVQTNRVHAPYICSRS